MKITKLILKSIVGVILLFLLFLSFLGIRVVLVPLFWIRIDNFQGVLKRFKTFDK